MALDIKSSFGQIKPNQGKVCDISREGEVLNKGGHFQGIQCIAGDQTNIILTSSSDEYAYVVLCELAYNESGNFVNRNVKAVVNIAGKGIDDQGGILYNHAGGFQASNDYIIIGVEDSKGQSSKIVFYQYIKNVLYQKNNLTILRPSSVPGLPPGHDATAGAVGFSFLNNPFFLRHGECNCLLAVGSWNCDTIDFYFSYSPSGEIDSVKPFQYFKTWKADTAIKLGWIDPNFAPYQSINLFISTDKNLYLIGTHNNDTGNWMDLYRIDFEAEEPEMLVKVDNKKMSLSSGCDFNKAGGACIVDNKLRIYAAKGDSGDWNKNGTVVIEYFDEQ